MCNNKNKCKKLAIVAIVHALTEHISAKNIVTAHILGKKVVMRKKDVQLGDKVVLVKADSIVPLKGWSKFVYQWYGNGRVRPHKFRGLQSDCIALPLSTFKYNPKEFKVGHDLTQELGIEPYINPKINPKKGKITVTKADWPW